MVFDINIAQPDRTVYELVRRQAVAEGYLPNIKSFQGDPDGYTAAKIAIRDDPQKGFIVEVLGIGTSEARSEKLPCRIILNRVDIQPSDLGGGTPFFTPDPPQQSPATFEKRMAPPAAQNIRYEFHILASSAKMERAVIGILTRALSFHRKYVKLVDEITLDDGLIDQLITYDGSSDVSTPEMIESKYRYSMNEIWIDASLLIRENVVPLSTTDITHRFFD